MSTPWKDNLAPGDMIMPAIFNSFFIGQALIEHSFGMWARAVPEERLHHLFAFYAWKSDQPILKYIMLALLLLIPFALGAILLDGVRSLFGLRKATTLRHAADVLQAVTIVTIVATIALQVGPTEQSIVDLASKCGAPRLAGKALLACTDTISKIEPLSLALLVLNILMAIGDYLKFRGNRIVDETKTD